METYSYISGSRLTVGGKVITPEGLTSVNPRALELAIKNKVIKKNKNVRREETNKT